jgi:O-antigen/teichoic acid export membrane protein
MVAYGLLSLARPAHQTLTGMGKVKFTALVYLFSTISMLVGLFFFSNEFGLLGAVASNLMLVLLLVFNLFLYFMFGVSHPWRQMLADLKWGLLLPILVYVPSLFSVSSLLSYKAFETAILGILLVGLIAKDSFILVRIKLLKASSS